MKRASEQPPERSIVTEKKGRVEDILSDAPHLEGANDDEKSSLGLANDAGYPQGADEVNSTQMVNEAGSAGPAIEADEEAPPMLCFVAGQAATIYHVPHDVVRLILLQLPIDQLLELRLNLGSRYLFPDFNFALTARAIKMFGPGAGWELVLMQRFHDVVALGTAKRVFRLRLKDLPVLKLEERYEPYYSVESLVEAAAQRYESLAVFMEVLRKDWRARMDRLRRIKLWRLGNEALPRFRTRIDTFLRSGRGFRRELNWVDTMCGIREEVGIDLFCRFGDIAFSINPIERVSDGVATIQRLETEQNARIEQVDSLVEEFRDLEFDFQPIRSAALVGRHDFHQQLSALRIDLLVQRERTQEVKELAIEFRFLDWNFSELSSAARSGSRYGLNYKYVFDRIQSSLLAQEERFRHIEPMLKEFGSPQSPLDVALDYTRHGDKHLDGNVWKDYFWDGVSPQAEIPGPLSDAIRALIRDWLKCGTEFIDETRRARDIIRELFSGLRNVSEVKGFANWLSPSELKEILKGETEVDVEMFRSQVADQLEQAMECWHEMKIAGCCFETEQDIIHGATVKWNDYFEDWIGSFERRLKRMHDAVLFFEQIGRPMSANIMNSYVRNGNWYQTGEAFGEEAVLLLSKSYCDTLGIDAARLGEFYCKDDLESFAVKVLSIKAIVDELFAMHGEELIKKCCIGWPGDHLRNLLLQCKRNEFFAEISKCIAREADRALQISATAEKVSLVVGMLKWDPPEQFLFDVQEAVEIPVFKLLQYFVHGGAECSYYRHETSEILPAASSLEEYVRFLLAAKERFEELERECRNRDLGRFKSVAELISEIRERPELFPYLSGRSQLQELVEKALRIPLPRCRCGNSSAKDCSTKSCRKCCRNITRYGQCRRHRK